LVTLDQMREMAALEDSCVNKVDEKGMTISLPLHAASKPLASLPIKSDGDVREDRPLNP